MIRKDYKSTRPQDYKRTLLLHSGVFFLTKDKSRKTKASATTDFTDFTDFSSPSKPLSPKSPQPSNFLQKTLVK